MTINHEQSLLATQITTITDCISQVNDGAVLDEQVQVQQVFQRIIHDLQHPRVCHEARTYNHFRDDPNQVLDGFALEFQDLARHLQTALAAHRLMEVPSTWKSAYAPKDCMWSTGVEVPRSLDVSADFLCLWKPPSNCTEINMKVSHMAESRQQTPNFVKNPLPNGEGIISRTSYFFDTSHYGPKRRVKSVHALQWENSAPHVDIVLHWERTMGRFWVRAQTAHYLWRPSYGLQSEIDKRLPADLLNGNKKFIGMHIRKTDNTASLQEDFGRDAEITRSLRRYMGIAETIRGEDPEVDTIYLATDNDKVVQEAENMTVGDWKLVVQRDVQRANTSEWMWFKENRAFGAAAIAADIEVLRRADFLIGSHQSNVYRLATELNTAWNVAKYPLRLNRLRTVDIPWYEDP